MGQKRVNGQLRVVDGHLTETKNIELQLRVDDMLASRGKRITDELRVEGGHATGIKKSRIPAVRQGWTCNTEKNGSGPSCESRVNLQLGQRSPDYVSRADLQLEKNERGE